MKNNSDKNFAGLMVVLFSVFFAVASIIIPIIIPSLLAYSVGRNKQDYENAGLYKGHILASMTFGGMIHFIVISKLANSVIKFNNPENFWHIIMVLCALNYLAAIIFYFIGRFVEKTKGPKVKQA